MEINTGQVLFFWLPLILCLLGFHGIFFYAHLWAKTAAWCLFQLGLIAFLLHLLSSGSPLPAVLILMISGVSAGVAILLGVFCFKVGRGIPESKPVEIDPMGAP